MSAAYTTADVRMVASTSSLTALAGAWMSLSGIINRFGGHKVVTFQLNGDRMPDLSQFGQVLESIVPRVKLRIDRQNVTTTLSHVLAKYTVEDVAVEDPPLEQVIADIFSTASENNREPA